MLDTLIAIDKAVFLFINVDLQNPVTNWFMPIITSDMLLRMAYAIVAILLLWKGNARLRWLVLFSAIALFLSDQLSAGFLKPLIARPRPCHTLTDIHRLVGCGGGYSMPSSHAANAFAQAALFSLTVRQTRWYLWAIAGLIAISRVFVGVHYPGDVLAGAVLGTLIGSAVVFGFEQFEQRVINRRRDKKPKADSESTNQVR